MAASPLAIMIKKKTDGSSDSSTPSGARESSAAEDFRDKARLYFAARGVTSPVEIDEEMLERVRIARRALFDRWEALPAGETLELAFPPARS